MVEAIIKEGAFFVPKNEIITWINEFYKIGLTKIEQGCTGAIYCQIFDSVHPFKIQMNKVNWKAKLEHEFINNYKILQQSFTKVGIIKVIDVEKLIKGKYQDNLEFFQWMKGYFDKNYNKAPYDAKERRNFQELEIIIQLNGPGTKVQKESSIKKETKSKTQKIISIDSTKFAKEEKISSPKTDINMANKNNNNNLNLNKNFINNISPINPVFESGKENFLSNKTLIFTNSTNSKINNEQNKEIKEEIIEFSYDEKLGVSNEKLLKLTQENCILNQENQKFKQDNVKLLTENKLVKSTLVEVARERDFYFSKLRDFEIILHKKDNFLNHSNAEIFELFQQILYNPNEVEVHKEELKYVVKNKID